jgi:parallel beta-helix repeat protein
VISNNEFNYNNAGGSGGAIYIRRGKARIIDNQLSYNKAGSSGGAICIREGDHKIINNLITHNIANRGGYSVSGGGGILLNSAIAGLINNTIADNADIGIYIYSSYVSLINTILSGNVNYLSSGRIENIFTNDYHDPLTAISFKNCLIEGGFATTYCTYDTCQFECPDCITGSPLFLDPENNMYELDFGSNACDKGTADTSGLSLPEVDLNQNPRIINQIIDIGAYEFNNAIKNRVPKINPFPDYYINPDDSLFLAITFDDPDLADTHSINITSDNPDVQIHDLSGNTSGSTFYIFPQNDEEDTTYLKITVMDNSNSDNSTDSVTFSIIRARSVHLNQYYIVHDMNWSSDTIKIYYHLVVDRDATLTISPGTYIEFQDNFEFSVKGQLLAIGDQGDSIHFNISPNIPDMTWQGIKFIFDIHHGNYPPEEISELNYCIIENADNGLYLEHLDDLKVLNCDIRNNKRGIYCKGGVTIEKCRIHDNITDNCGGGLNVSGYDYNKSARIYNNLIYNNSAIAEGGGIYLSGSDVLLLGNVIYQNTANSGGGIGMDHFANDNDLINNTIVQNIAQTGGGIYFYRDHRCINNIFQYNIATVYGDQVAIHQDGYGLYIISCYIDGDFNDAIRSGYSFAGELINSFSENSDFVDTAANNYTLSDNSICINSGLLDPSLMFRYDQNAINMLKIIYGKIDIGAIEFEGYADNRLPVIDQTNELYIRTDKPATLNIGYSEFDTEDTLSVQILYDDNAVQIKNIILTDASIQFIIEPVKNVSAETEIILTLLDRTNSINYQNSDTFKLHICNTHFYCGSINKNTVWEADTIIIACNVTVNRDAELIIVPGTKVFFMENTGILVEGVLTATGLPGEEISFSSDDGQWSGIIISPFNELSLLNGDTSVMDYCLLSNTATNGLTIQRSEFILSNSRITENIEGGIKIWYSSPKITKNIISGNTGYGISVQGSPLIEGNILELNKSAVGTIICYDGDPIIYGNIIRDNQGFAIDCGGYSNTVRVNIINNIIYGTSPYMGNGGSAIYCHYLEWDSEINIFGNLIFDNHSVQEGGAIHLNYTDKLNPEYLINNTIVNNSSEILGGGIYISRQSKAILYNNILWGNSTNEQADQIGFGYATGGAVIENCNLQPGTDGFISWPDDMNNIDTINIIIGNPEFLKYYANDFRLVKSSACVNAGVLKDFPVQLPEYDLSGSPRISDSIIDIGAYELLCHDYEIELNQTICEGDIYQVGDSIINSSGQYSILLQDQFGCDSLVNLNLHVIPLPYVFIGNDTTINENDTLKLDAGPDFINYSWNNGSIEQGIGIYGLNKGEYIYFVNITDSSGCENSDTIVLTIKEYINTIAVKDIDLELKIFPNPSSGDLNIEIKNIQKELSLIIVSSQGQVIWRKELSTKSLSYSQSIHLNSLAPGIYFLKIISENCIKLESIIVK